MRISDWSSDVCSSDLYGLMRDELGAMSEEEKAEVETFFHLATVVKDYGALKLVDLYNSIPYSEALRGTEAVFFPKFDDPEEVYKSILDELKMIGEILPASYGKMSEDAKSKLQVQDLDRKSTRLNSSH